MFSYQFIFAFCAPSLLPCFSFLWESQTIDLCHRFSIIGPTKVWWVPYLIAVLAEVAEAPSLTLLLQWSSRLSQSRKQGEPQHHRVP